MVQWLKPWATALTMVAAVTSVAHAAVDDPAGDQAETHTVFPLFRSANMDGADKLESGIGFHSFRIPAVATTTTGRILAFAEGRRHNNRDYGDINLVYKRTKTTTDHGATEDDWEPLGEVVGSGDGTWGNPTPVIDGETIYLFLSWNSGSRSQNGGDVLPDGTVTDGIDDSWEGRRHLYLTTSTDDGATWSEPEDVTKTLTPDSQAWDAVGPGNGIVLSSGELVVPAQGRNLVGKGTPGNRTWTYQAIEGAGSEGTIAQTPDGNLYRNDRGSDGYRIVARGTLEDGFDAFALDDGLPDPGCEGSLLQYNLDEPARMVFLNSASQDSRRYLRVRFSYDEDAAKYNYGRELSDEPITSAGNEGGYSSLTKTHDWKIGALVETDFFNDGTGGESYRALVWRRFNLSWVINGPNN